MSSQALYIDCQILQTVAFDRGMGKYTSSLLKYLAVELSKNKAFSQVTLVLNRNLESSKERIAYISKLFPDASVDLLNLPTDFDKDTLQKTSEAEATLSSYLDEISVKKDVSYIVTAPFFVGFASVYPPQKSIKKFTLIYDFIPYRIWSKKRIFPDDLYFQHFRLFLESDGMFTISEFVKRDLIELFGFSERKITSIDGGASEQLAPKDISKNQLKSPYIMYPSAPIIHKNNETAVKGFELFNRDHGNKYKLVITSTFDDDTKNKLQNYSENIVFTGNISDEELFRYYHHANALLFASLAEGLGMPILEAVHHSLPIACSDIPVLTEISEEALYLFDPTDERSICSALSNAVERSDFDKKLSDYKRINMKYSWNRTARLLADKIIKSSTLQCEKKSLLVVMTDTNTDNKGARFIEYMYAQLNEQFNVTLNIPKQKVGTNKLQAYIAYLGSRSGINKEPYDFSLIQKSNSLTLDNDVFSKQIKFGKKNILNKHRKDTIYISAQRKFIDKPLGLKGWVYSIEAQSKTSTAESIINSIMTDFN